MVTATSARSSESGFTLVALAIAVTILTVLLAVSLPAWKQITQREKEEELIFRGWQYVEAIRVFQQRQGRLPTRLDELIKVKPRSIRQLWKDPMTDSGEWGLIFQGTGSSRLRGQDLTGGTGPGGLGGFGNGTGNDGRDDQEDGKNGATGPNGQRVTVGPIVGVHSLSTDSSIKVLFGQEEYDQWQFTIDLLGQQGRQNPQIGTNPGGLQTNQGVPNVRWIGRPFRQGLVPQGGNGLGLQNGTGVGGQPATDANGRPLGTGGQPPGNGGRQVGTGLGGGSQFQRRQNR